MPGSPPVVHVVGTGTIGEPLIGLLIAYREEFGIDEITFHKKQPLLTDRSKVMDLLRRGARLCVEEEDVARFQDIGLNPAFTHAEAVERATVIIDCTPHALENRARLYDTQALRVNGIITQVAAGGFGTLYARGINDRAMLRPDGPRHLQIASDNTHNLAVLIKTIACRGGENPDNLTRGRFTVIRRANDMSEGDGFVASHEVSRPIDPRFGSHHARDAWEMLRSDGWPDLDIVSTALKTNTQYMHTIQFDMSLRDPVSLDEVAGRITNDDRLALTYKNSSAEVFSFGRDHGFFGRLLNQTVVPIETLHIHRDGLEISGFAFTSQEGNALLSTIAATLHFLDPESYYDRLQVLKTWFFDEI